jgi:hypothetical protein
MKTPLSTRCMQRDSQEVREHYRVYDDWLQRSRPRPCVAPQKRPR